MTWADGTTTTRTQEQQELLHLYGANAGVQWLSGDGNDSRSGRGPGQAKLTLAAAYAALPSTGGTIFALPGLYDLGSGFVGSRQKLLDLIGIVKPTKVIGSATTTPLTSLSASAAVFRASGNPQSMISWTGGSSVATYQGLKFQNLVFEISGSAMERALYLPNACRSEVSGNLFFADKTTSPAPFNALGALFRSDGTTGADSSWNRVYDNEAINCGLVRFGNLTGSGVNNSINQNVIRENVCLGRDHTSGAATFDSTNPTTSAEPAISIIGGHRCSTRDNNLEAYKRGVFADRCWQCSFDGDGGEVTDYFYDLISTHACYLKPLGPSFKNLGSSTPKSWVTAGAAFLVRGDTFTRRNIVVIPSVEDASSTNGAWNPTDDPTYPAIQLASTDNVVISPRWSKAFNEPGGTSTSTPGAVTTVNIAHGLGVAPTKFDARPGNTNARGAPAYSVTADATNVILSFASALTAATSYSWNWWAAR